MNVSVSVNGDINDIYKKDILPLVSKAESKRVLAFVAEATKQELTDILNRAPLGTVSDPGDPPKTKTGNFVRSITIFPTDNGYRVYPTVSYADRLELLTNRPWSEFTAIAVEDKLSSLTRDALK